MAILSLGSATSPVKISAFLKPIILREKYYYKTLINQVNN